MTQTRITFSKALQNCIIRFHALLFEFCFSSSADAPLIVCGRSSLYVSGSLEANIPDKMIGTPTISIGKGCQILAKGLKNGAQAQKTLAIAEDIPRACTLKLVG